MRSFTIKHFLPNVVLLFTLLFSATLLPAQDNSSMTGVVTDATGAVIPGAVVTLSNPSTGVKFTQATDNLGSYRFANIPPNTGYRATFAHAGFTTSVVSDITLNVAITRTQNVRLAVGGTMQEIQVSAASQEVTLNTTDATIGNNIDVQSLNTLPVYDRTAGIATLFMQQPGVDSYQGSVTGARIDQSEVTLDGLDVDDISSGQTFSIVGNAPVDSVEQFTGSVAGLTSSTGTGSGAQFQLVSKGGTNKFHGNVNEYHRDTTTVANSWFNNLSGLPRTALIRNQFGGDIGGPIKKDKLFFYFDLADSKIRRSATADRTVPLSQFRNGTLNYINNGAGCGDSTHITSLTSLPACISTLSANDLVNLDPGGKGFSQSMQNYISGTSTTPGRYPYAATAHGKPDLSNGDGVNTVGYRFTFPVPDNEITYVGRVDYNLTATQKIFGRFTITRDDTLHGAPEFPSDPVTHPETDRSYSYVVSHIWNIGQSKVNQFYYGDTISKLDFPDTYNPTGDNQYSISGLDGPYTSYNGQKRRVPVPMVRDDFSWQRGRHSFTMGGSFKFIKTNSDLTSNFNYPGIGQAGSALSGGLGSAVRPTDIAVGGTGTINANKVAINDYDSLFASALGVIGEISTNYTYDNKGNASKLGSGELRAYRFFETEAYFGDTWKVTPKLTVSYGVRYQLNSVPYETHGSESVPVTSPKSGLDLNTFIQDRLVQSKAGDTSNTGLPIFSYVLGGKANHGPDLYDMSYKDFAPRVAFAYTPFTSQKTVINGGAGIVYDRTVINSINFLLDQIPNMFSNSPTNQFGSNSGAAASLAADPRVGTGLSYDISLNPAATPITTPYTPYVDDSGYPYGLANGQSNFVVSKNLKDPYSIALNFGVQQEIPGHMILKVNYVGRLGRRLLADADANQVIDVPDYTGGSTQSMSQAYAKLTADLRAGNDYTTVAAQPWFEDVIGAQGTAIVAYYSGQLAQRGDISDSLQTLAYYGYLPTNIGIPAQFGTNAYLTNKGSSNYHGLLLTLDKNLSQGLRFEFNYTWSHSIDNTSLSTNNNALFSNTGMICDILQPRACRGNSDFDIRQDLTSNFTYNLPVGRGKDFLATAPHWLDEAVGGWSVSGLISYRTGLAVTAYSHAYLGSFDNNDPAIFTGNKKDLKAKVNVDHTTNIVYDFAGGSDGAAKVAAEFRGPLGIEYGQRNLLKGPGAFFFDAGLGKTFPVVGDRLKLVFRADAFNILNHPNFGPPGGMSSATGSVGGSDIVSNASAFGQIYAADRSPSSSAVSEDGARVAQFSLRLEF